MNHKCEADTRCHQQRDLDKAAHISFCIFLKRDKATSRMLTVSLRYLFCLKINLNNNLISDMCWRIISLNNNLTVTSHVVRQIRLIPTLRLLGKESDLSKASSSIRYI